MFGRLIKGALLFTAGAAVGAAGALWLMSEEGKQMRGELRNMASQARNKFQECCEQIKQEMEADNGQATE